MAQPFISIDEFSPFAVKKRGGRKRCGTGGELHGTAVAEVEVWPDHYCGPGASPKPRDPFFIRQSAYLPEGPSKARGHAKLKTET